LTAGLPTSAQPLGGWEAPNDFGRGEFFGHCLSACAMLYAQTGDERLKAKTDYLVAELAKCQKALGTSGYLHAEPESYFDKLERGENVMGIYYTVHKIMAGLLDVYVYCHNRQALEIAEGMGRWVNARAARLTPEHWQKVLDVEFGGINEALYNLYAITGKPEYLEAARRFDHEKLYRPLAEGHDELTGLHANTNIPKIVGAARGYELTGEQRLRRVAEFFWSEVAQKRSYCTGGTSNHEFWRTPPGKLADELSNTTQECCCTYNMLKLTRQLFTWTADAKYADFYERGLFNGILGTMNPQTGLTMYYVPLEAGYWKTFGSRLDSFWCCTGTGSESFSKLADSIYFHDAGGLWVNQFIASELSWPQKGLKLRQETRFPEQEGTSLVVEAAGPEEITLYVRLPYWAARPVTIKLNGSPVDVPKNVPAYASIRRKWRADDRVDVDLPMALHLAPMPDDKNLVAVMYGPLVLAGRLGLQGLTPEKLAANSMAPEGPPCAAPWFVSESDDPATWIRPVAGKKLEFQTFGQQKDITLVPLDRLFGERYGVYWNLYRKGSPEHQARVAQEEHEKRLAARIVDEVAISDEASEKAHALAGENMASGEGSGRHWRHAMSGGWFAYKLKTLPEEAMTLRCSFWGGDLPPREFDILVDGTRVATQKLDRDKPGEFFWVEYEIPAELTRGKQSVEVRFKPHDGNTAGGVFGLQMLKPEAP
jgi:DUF1680 family protein